MKKNIVSEIEKELDKLGFNQKPIEELPDVINRVYITINMAKLFYKDQTQLKSSDSFWCSYFSHYIHFFDNDNFERLGKLYLKLTKQMEKDNCFR